MHRRSFLAGSALAGALAPPAVALAAEALKRHHGREVRLTGVLSVTPGPGHCFALSKTLQLTDPCSEDVADWPEGLVRVYPRDAAKMRDGKVEIVGRLSVGRFVDAPTGLAAAVVLTDARIV